VNFGKKTTVRIPWHGRLFQARSVSKVWLVVEDPMQQHLVSPGLHLKPLHLLHFTCHNSRSSRIMAMPLTPPAKIFVWWSIGNNGWWFTTLEAAILHQDLHFSWIHLCDTQPFQWLIAWHPIFYQVLGSLCILCREHISACFRCGCDFVDENMIKLRVRMVIASSACSICPVLRSTIRFFLV